MRKYQRARRSWRVFAALVILGSAKYVLGVRGVIRLLPRGRASADEPAERRRVARALSREIDWAAAALPRQPRCLTRSLVLLAALRLRGFPAMLQIGVGQGEGFAAHAWVEADGVPLGRDGAGGAALVRLWTAR